MMSHIYRQFERPHGALGAIAGFVMSHRPSNRERNRWTVELIAPEENARVLEIGCGPGLALAATCERVTVGRIVGVDHSPLMLAQAAKRNRQAIETGRLQLHLGGLDSLAALNPDFDVAYSINVAMFWRDRPSALRAIHRVLRPHGRLATTYQPRHRGAKSADAFKFAEQLRGDMSTLGFTDLRIEQLALHPLPAVCVLTRRGD
jgi:ubiquinone/menaquinone biosynthesis C-methylase UbiE